MGFTIYQVKVALVVFLCLYVVLGVISLIIWRYISSDLISSFQGYNLDLNLLNLITAIDISMHATWILYNSFLIVGIVILIYAVIGGIGLFLQNIIILKAFGFLLLIIASMKVPIIAYSLHASSTNASSIAESYLWNNFRESMNNSLAAIARNYVQDRHICCGVVDYKDYSILFKNESIIYPKSCCSDDSKECSSSSEVKQAGCAENMAKSFHKSYEGSAGFFMFLTILEVPATIMCFYLAYLIKDRNKRIKGNFTTTDRLGLRY